MRNAGYDSVTPTPRSIWSYRYLIYLSEVYIQSNPEKQANKVPNIWRSRVKKYLRRFPAFLKKGKKLKPWNVICI